FSSANTVSRTCCPCTSRRCISGRTPRKGQQARWESRCESIVGGVRTGADDTPGILRHRPHVRSASSTEGAPDPQRPQHIVSALTTHWRAGSDWIGGFGGRFADGSRMLMARVMMIGLDAASLDFIDESRASLPNLRRLLDMGVSQRLWSRSGELFPASVWPTFYTATQPGRHGVYHPLQWDHESMSLRATIDM